MDQIVPRVHDSLHLGRMPNLPTLFPDETLYSWAGFAHARNGVADVREFILVDEFQDTSPLQLALFVELAKLAKRSVWVGDPKQAIYGFRGTDARLIAGVLGAIETWGGTLGEPLTTSRRSTPGLVSLTNAVFETAFLPELAPADVQLQPSRPDFVGQAALFNWNFESKKNETDYLGLGQAVGEFIRSGFMVEDKASKQHRPVRPGDIAVLCRMNSKLTPQVDLAVASLTRWGIPCASPRAGLLGTPEVLFVMACLRRILDAGDTVASALILTLADGVPLTEWLADRLQFLSTEGARYGTTGEGAMAVHAGGCACASTHHGPLALCRSNPHDDGRMSASTCWPEPTPHRRGDGFQKPRNGATFKRCLRRPLVPRSGPRSAHCCRPKCRGPSSPVFPSRPNRFTWNVGNFVVLESGPLATLLTS